MAKNPNLKRAHETSEYDPEKVLELKKCMEDPVYFMINYVKVQHPTKGAVAFELYEYQIEMVRAIHENKDTLLLCSRQMGKTTVAAMYILWFALFHRAKRCVIASKAMSHAVEIQSRIKFAYEELPMWLKAGCTFYNRTSIEFDNKSVIICEATSEKTGRGSSPAIIFLDEIAFISRRIQDEMWGSLTPSLSTGGKFIISSTPNGDSELFAQLWRAANSKQNNFVPLRFLWWQHPDRGEAYYKEMVGKLGELRARQELDCEFLSSDALLVNSIVLQSLRWKAPVFTTMGFKFWWPEDKLCGPNNVFLVSMDPASGSGKDFSVIEIFEFNSMEQVGEFRSNEINIPLLYAKLQWVLKLLTRKTSSGGQAEVLWTFERNGLGEAIAALYFNDDKRLDEAELFSDHPMKFGLYTTGKQKILSCLQLKTLVEKTTNGFVLNSEDLIAELKEFVSKGGGYEAKAGATDDCVMATVGITRLLKRLSEYNDKAFKTVNEYLDPEEQANQAMDESDLPVPFSFS